MAVSKSLQDGVLKKYGVKTTNSSGVATSATPKKVAAAVPAAPNLWDTLKNAPKQAVENVTKTVTAANKVVQPIAKRVKEDFDAMKPQMLKDELKSLPVEARAALRKNAVPVAGGFMLPSVDDPELGRYEGLVFTEDEWGRGGYNAKFAGGVLGTSTGKEQKIQLQKSEMDSIGDFFKGLGGVISNPAKAAAEAMNPTSEDVKFWVENDINAQTDERMRRLAAREEAAGLDYLAKLRLSKPTNEKYGDVDWSNPMTYFNMFIGGKEGAITEAFMPTSEDPASTDPFMLYRTTREPAKAGMRSGIEVKKALGGMLEKTFSNDSYFKWAGTLGESLADDARIELMKRNDLNPDAKIQGKDRFSQVDYYTSAFASAIPHFVGSVIAAGAGALIGGAGGAAAGSFGYSSSVEGGSMYNMMLEKGYNLKDANDAATVYGTLAGALDSLLPGELGGKAVTPIARQMLAEGVKHSVRNEIVNFAKKGILNALKEGTTEAAQELMQNATLAFYGENQDIWENVIDSFIGGALVGGVMTAIDNDANAVQPSMDGMPTPQGAPQEDTNDETPMPQPATPDDVPAGMSTAGIDRDIEEALQRGGAYTATVALGEQLLANGVPAEVIEPLLEEARAKAAEENDGAKVDTARYMEATKTPVIQNETVNIDLGQTPTGEYGASGSMTVGNKSVTLPFDIERTFPTQSEAVVDSVSRLEGWLTKQLATDGITNEESIAQAVASLDDAREMSSGMEDFVIQNQERVLTAQDSMNVEDFQNTLTERGDVMTETDIMKLYRKATSPDAVRITGQQAKAVVRDLAEGLGVRVETVAHLAGSSEGKVAFGKFVQQVYGDNKIVLKSADDGTADVNLNTPLHEVGHAYFRTMLTDKQRSAVLDEVRTKHRKKNMSDAAAEEVLVEDLKSYAFKKSKRESRYGKVLAKLIDMGERLVRWLGNDPQGKIDSFYSDILAKKRPSERAAFTAREKEMQAFQEEQELIATHNLGIEQFRKVIALGGLAAPSVSINEVADAQEGFGDITLVLNKEVVDPELDRAARVFDRDVYSVRFPDLEYKINKEALRNFYKTEAAFLKESTDLPIPRSGEEVPAMNYMDARKVDNIIYDSGATKLAFALRNGAAIEQFVEESRTAETTEQYGQEAVDFIVSNAADLRYLSEYDINNDARIKSLATDFAALYANQDPEMKEFLYDKNGAINGPFVVASVRNLLHNYSQKAEISNSKISSYIWENRDAYGSYVSGIVDSFVDERVLPRTHERASLENVTRAMVGKNVRAKEDSLTYGLNKALARGAREFKSIGQIKKNPLFNNPDHNEIYDNVQTHLLEKMEEFDYPYDNTFEKFDDFFRGIGGFLASSRTENALKRELAKRGFITKDDALITSIRSDVLQMADMPVSYYEAKIQRAVYLSEIAAVIAPSNYEKEVNALIAGTPLQERVSYYGSGIERSRAVEMAARNATEVFQEADASDDGDDAQFFLPDIEEPKSFGDVMELTPYKNFPEKEQQNYLSVVKALLNAEKDIKDSDANTVEPALRMADVAFRYDAYLLKEYGVGLDPTLLEVANRAYERAEDVLTFEVIGDDMTIFPKSTRQSLARDMLNIARPIAKIVRDNSTYMGETVDDIFSKGYGDIYEVVSNYVRQNPGSVTEREMAAWNEYKRIGEAVEESVEQMLQTQQDSAAAYHEELMETVRRAVSGNRVYKSRIYEEADMIADYAVKVAKNRDRMDQMRARLVNMRVARIEREEMLARTKTARRTKQRIHQNIMRQKEEATVNMTEAQALKERLRAEGRGYEAGAKDTRKELRDAYRLARQRRELVQQILDTKTKMSARIREGKFVDVEYGKKLLALFDTFQKSQVTQATLDKLDALLEDKANGVYASVGTKDDTTGDVYTKEKADIDAAYINRIRKRLTQRPLATMTTEELDMLYTEISAVIQQGRNKLLFNRYMSEEQKAARLADVLEGTTNIDSGALQKLNVAIFGEDAERVGKNTKQNALEMVPAYSVTDTIDGAKLFRGKNTAMLQDINQGEYAFTREKSEIADDLVAGYKALGLPKELTQIEQDFLTYVARLREGEDGEFVAKQIIDQNFGGTPPTEAGRLKLADAEAIVDLLQEIHAKYNLTSRLGGAYEARTNKIFMKAQNYVAPSKFKNPPQEWISAEEEGIDILQTFGRNGYGVSDKFSLSRVAADVDLVPRTDLFNLFIEGVENSLWYIHMQPAIDNVQQVVGTKEYRKAAGVVAQTWWKEHLTLMAQRGQRVGANKFDLLDKARNNVVTSMLSLKATSILIQVTQPITAALTALPLVGARASMNVFLETAMSLTPGYMENALEMSGAVVARRGTAGSLDVADARRVMQRDANKARNIIRSSRDTLIEWGMKPMQELDVRFSAASRQAVYKALTSQGVSEEEASVQADFTMEVMNSSALTSNKPHIYSRGSIQRFFLMLQSFSIGWYSLMTTIVAGTLKSGSARQYAYGAIAVLGAPLAQALYANMIYSAQNAILGRDMDDEEEENPLVMIGKEYLYNVPLAGGILRSKLEYGRDAWNPVITSLFRTMDGIETVWNEEDPEKRMKGAAKAAEGAFTLLGVPYTAQGFDLLEPFLKSQKERKSANLKSAGKQLVFGSATETEIDRATAEALAVTYGDKMSEIKQTEKTAARKSVVKAMATSSSNEYVREIAGSSTNDEKAVVLMEADSRLDSGEFDSMVGNLKRYGLLSDEGYKKYLEKKHK